MSSIEPPIEHSDTVEVLEDENGEEEVDEK
jgi:hypothetical protein